MDERLETLERIAEALRELDWCLGYELTESQQIRLDEIRDTAWSLVSQTFTDRLKKD
jgi:hypothetical protein